MIIDALEYQLPPNRSHPGVASPAAASPPLASTSPEDADGAGTHTFKVVTTKRTLLLCAPSEEEEIKWLSAIRALLARRSGQGVVPGEPHLSAAAAVTAAPPGGVGPANANALGSTVGPISRRRDSIVRRLSLSGSASNPLASAGVAVAPASAAVGAHPHSYPHDAPPERQS